jgi:hypothetical protein
MSNIYNILAEYQSINLIQCIIHFIQHKRLHIKFFDAVSDDVVYDIMRDNKLIKSKSQAIQFLIQSLHGCIVMNCIYVRRNMTNIEICATVAHEFIHFIRRYKMKYISDAEKFKEEFLADLAYHHVMQSNLDRMKIADNIIALYCQNLNVTDRMMDCYTDEYNQTIVEIMKICSWQK